MKHSYLFSDEFSPPNFYLTHFKKMPQPHANSLNKFQKFPYPDLSYIRNSTLVLTFDTGFSTAE